MALPSKSEIKYAFQDKSIDSHKSSYYSKIKKWDKKRKRNDGKQELRKYLMELDGDLRASLPR